MNQEIPPGSRSDVRFIRDRATDSQLAGILDQRDRLIDEVNRLHKVEAERDALRDEVERLKAELESAMVRNVWVKFNNKVLREACESALLQIEYLHAKFAETGTGNQVVAQLRAALAAAVTGEEEA